MSLIRVLKLPDAPPRLVCPRHHWVVCSSLVCECVCAPVVWGLELIRLIAVLLSPCFFGMALYESIVQINTHWPEGWTGSPMDFMIVRL